MIRANWPPPCLPLPSWGIPGFRVPPLGVRRARWASCVHGSGEPNSRRAQSRSLSASSTGTQFSRNYTLSPKAMTSFPIHLHRAFIYPAQAVVAGFSWLSRLLLGITSSIVPSPALLPGCSLLSACSLPLVSRSVSMSMLGPTCEEMMSRFRMGRMRLLSSASSTCYRLQLPLIITL